MYCRECGKQLPDGSQFCDNCGKEQKAAVVATVEYSNTQNGSVKTNGLCIAGFVLSLVAILVNVLGIVSIIATVLSAVGIQKCKERDEDGHGLGVAGLVIGIVVTVLNVLSTIACAGFFANI